MLRNLVAGNFHKFKGYSVKVSRSTVDISPLQAMKCPRPFLTRLVTSVPENGRVSLGLSYARLPQHPHTVLWLPNFFWKPCGSNILTMFSFLMLQLDRILAIFSDPHTKDPLEHSYQEGLDLTFGLLFEGPSTAATQTSCDRSFQPSPPSECLEMVEGSQQGLDPAKEVNLDVNWHSSASFLSPFCSFDSSLLDPIQQIDAEYLQIASSNEREL